MRFINFLKSCFLAFALSAFASNACAQINNPAPYCACTQQMMYNMWNTLTINNATHNFGAMGSAAQNGQYQYYNNANIFPMFTTGGQINISLVPYSVNDAEPRYFALYIDYNQNGIFDPAELVLQNSNSINADLPTWGAAVTTIVKTITIPATAMIGVTRMRLIRGTDLSTPYGAYDPNFVLSPCTATANGPNYGQTVDFDVNIAVGVPSVQVASITVSGQNNATTIATPNGTLQMNAAVAPANATNKTVTWSVMNGTGNASISAAGLLTAIADGTVTVIATANDGSNVTGQQVITISNQPPVPVASITVNGQNNATQIATKNGTLQMLATVLPSNANNSSVTWSVANVTGSATISTTGLLTAVANGIVKVTATANDGSNVSGSINVTISNQASVPVPITSITVSGKGNASTITTKGGTLQMMAAVLPVNATNDSITWSVVNGTTGSAAIDPTGLLTALTDGIVLVKATSHDGSNIEGTKAITLSGQTTSVADIFKGKLDLYPNPANASLHLKFEEQTVVKRITVYSVAGGQVSDKVVNNSVTSYELGTNSLAPGNYFLKVLTGDGSVALLKFTKQ